MIASEKGDLPTMLNFLSDDVIFMVVGKEAFGKETFARNYKQMKGTKIRTEIDIRELKVIGDWAWMRSFLTVTFTPATADTSVHSGYVLTIFRKGSNGNWVITRDANLLMPVDGLRSNSVEAKS